MKSLLSIRALSSLQITLAKSRFFRFVVRLMLARPLRRLNEFRPKKGDSSGVLLAFFMIVSRPTHGLRVAHEVPIEQEMPKSPGGGGELVATSSIERMPVETVLTG